MNNATTFSPPLYEHTQTCLLWSGLMMVLVPVFVFVGFTFPSIELQGLYFALAIMMLTFAASFCQLTIADDVDRLRVSFGPLPTFRCKILYSDLQSATVSRTTWLDGWGLHWSIRGGWVWNIWGWSCVELRMKNRKMWLGTDDAENLATFLQTKIAERSSAT